MLCVLVFFWQTDVNVDVLWWVTVMAMVCCRHFNCGVVLQTVDCYRWLCRLTAMFGGSIVIWFLHILSQLVFMMIGRYSRSQITRAWWA